MDRAQLQDLIQSYKYYESQFFQDHYQGVRDSFLYGEIGFCLAGLKPAVLIDFPAPLLDQYLAAVMTPWLTRWIDSIGASDANDWHLVKRHLTSPELADGIPVAFLVHTTHPRLASSSIGHCLLAETQERLDVVNEDDLAFILDYPGHLPRSLDDLNTMREVAYYDQASQLVLTTFAAQLDQQRHVQQHFESYKNTMAPLGIHLGLIFRSPAA